MEELVEVCLGVPHQEDVVHGNGAEEVQEKPGLDVLFSNQLWVEDDFVSKVVQNDPCERNDMDINWQPDSKAE